MDHAEVRELLDLAAAEPGGLDRLMAGDTDAATALAGHLAGCDSCMAEFSRIRRAAGVLREVIASQPRPELRAQTLAYVAALGRPRAAADAPVAPVPPVSAEETSRAAEPVAVAAAASAEPTQIDAATRARRRRRQFGWLAAAAALVIAVAGVSGFAVNASRDAAARQMSQQLEGLVEVAASTAQIDAEPDARHVVLTASTPGQAMPDAIGSLVFSPGTRQLVVVADGLSPAPAGKEYRCWVEIGGDRQRLGKMYMAGDLAYWTGDSDDVAMVPDGSRFGVSLADIDATGGANPVILSGTLQGS